MRSYICLQCSFVNYLESVTVHLYKHHLNVAAPLQCSCGYIADRDACLERHMKKKGCTAMEVQTSVVPLHLMMREATQSERRAQRKRKVPVAQSFVLTEERLDYQDWDAAGVTSTEPWTESKKKIRQLESENERLMKEINELKKINDVMSAEMLEPNVGVFSGSALSGFEAAWEEETRRRPASALFADPPQRLQSSVTVPDSNHYLTRN